MINYQFFGPIFVTYTLFAFQSYYKNYNGSEIQKQYFKDTQLTKSEKESLFKESHNILKTGILTNSDKKELKKCGINLHSFAQSKASIRFQKELTSKLSFFNTPQIESEKNEIVILKSEQPTVSSI